MCSNSIFLSDRFLVAIIWILFYRSKIKRKLYTTKTELDFLEEHGKNYLHCIFLEFLEGKPSEKSSFTVEILHITYHYFTLTFTVI